jgi:hypothetical protein
VAWLVLLAGARSGVWLGGWVLGAVGLARWAGGVVVGIVVVIVLCWLRVYSRLHDFGTFDFVNCIVGVRFVFVGLWLGDILGCIVCVVRVVCVVWVCGPLLALLKKYPIFLPPLVH